MSGRATKKRLPKYVLFIHTKSIKGIGIILESYLKSILSMTESLRTPKEFN